MKDNKTFRFFLSVAKPHILWIVLLCIFNFSGAGLSVILALVSRNVIDIATGSLAGSLINSCLTLAGIIFLMLILAASSTYINSLCKAKLDIALKSRLFASYIDKKYSKAIKHHSGEILNRLTSDVDHVVSGIVDLLPSLVSIVTRIVASLIVIIYFSWTFAFAVLMVGAVAFITSRILGKKFKEMHKNCQQSSGAVRSFMQESAENLIVVKTFSGNQPVLDRVGSLMKADFRNKMKRAVLSVFAHSSINLIFTGGYYIALGWGAIQVALGVMSFGSLTAFLQIVSQVRMPFMNASGLLSRYYAASASAERIIEIEEMEIEQEIDKSILDENIKSIQMHNLSFSYDGVKYPIKNGTADIKFGEITTIVGGSGSGKSTTFKLLLGLYDATDGSLEAVCEDGKTIPLSAATRPLFNYVPQGNFVLTGSIKENITFFNDGIDEQRIIEAAKAAEIYDVISSLPDGFDTKIGERGIGLSEGQIQRIAIARALIFNAPVLLLDECTSALDGETESKILANIRNMKTKTVIIITHRPKALDISDSVLRVDDGKVIKEK
ncbi:MAG: ABC transporter ATP-binding protein [Clostridia bacterium]|nr:ABC transporter ATP-binding protein [Clostridia bacterium]